MQTSSFRYKNSDQLFSGVSCQIQQGQFVGICGAMSSGKGVLLDLISGVMEQESGQVFVPPHLRILYVSRNPLVWGGSVSSNVFFGLSDTADELGVLDGAVLERAYRICQRLNFPPRLMSLVVSDATMVEVSAALSRSDRKLVHLARALIYNPEVLVVHTPGMYFDNAHKSTVMEALSEFVECRGSAGKVG